MKRNRQEENAGNMEVDIRMMLDRPDRTICFSDTPANRDRYESLKTRGGVLLVHNAKERLIYATLENHTKSDDTRVVIDFQGAQGAGKTLLSRAIEVFLKNKNIQVFRLSNPDRDILDVVLSAENRKKLGTLE